jgi:hypothetical protein
MPHIGWRRSAVERSLVGFCPVLAYLAVVTGTLYALTLTVLESDFSQLLSSPALGRR